MGYVETTKREKIDSLSMTQRVLKGSLMKRSRILARRNAGDPPHTIPGVRLREGNFQNWGRKKSDYFFGP